MVQALSEHGTNLVGIATARLASTIFNENPEPLHISGVLEGNRDLFRQLEDTADAEAAAQIFQAYMTGTFALNPMPEPAWKGTERRFRASYLRVLKGWGYDASSREGALLKGWVESRFGLFPTYHKSALGRYPSPAWLAYIEDKMAGRFHNNNIFQQLDLLYEFCQWSIGRWFAAGNRHLTLYRGANHPVREFLAEDRALPRRGAIIAHLNNLVSFTADRNVACEFGDYILEAHVPTVKVLFFNDLLPWHPLRGEDEYLVVGGDYRLGISYL